MALDYTTIGHRLKTARINKNYTQEELSEKLGVSIAFLSRIERGNSHISLKRLNEICNILGITEGYILNGASTTSTGYLNAEFDALFSNCPPDKINLIYKIAKIIAEHE
jgi:transcriptional regulator with XRE-family HTH domain